MFLIDSLFILFISFMKVIITQEGESYHDHIVNIYCVIWTWIHREQTVAFVFEVCSCFCDF